MVRQFGFLALGLLVLTACSQAPKRAESKELVKAEIGSIKILTTQGGFYFAGQPSKDDFKKLKDEGFRTIINYRPAKEQGWDERGLVEELGMRYEHIPYAGTKQLTDEVFARSRELIRSVERPAMLHCKSSNRVGAIWYAARVLDQGVDEAQALDEAKRAGLRSKGYIERTVAYVKSQKN